MRGALTLGSMWSTRGEQINSGQFPIVYEGLPELAYQFLLPDDLGGAVHVARGAGAAYELIPREGTKRTKSSFATDAQNVASPIGEPWVNIVIAEPAAAQHIANALFNDTSFPVKIGWLNDVRANRINSILSFETRAAEQPDSQYRKLEPHIPESYRPRAFTSLQKVEGFGPVMGLALLYTVRLALCQAITEHQQTYTPLLTDDKVVRGRSWSIAQRVRDSFFHDQVLPFTGS